MTTPSPAAAGLPLEDVERVARRMAAELGCATATPLTRRMAAAALAEMRPTTAVPDPRGACADCVRVNGGVCCVPENCAAVPDPRFRDQLAEDTDQGPTVADSGALISDRSKEAARTVSPVVVHHSGRSVPATSWFAASDGFALREWMVEKAVDTFLASRQTAWEDLSITPRQWANGLIDALMSRIAAEVEARVQAALAPVPSAANGGEER